MLDHTTKLLTSARQKARHIHKRQDRDFKGITEPHKTRRLARTINIQTARQHHRLIGHHTYG